MNGGWFRRLLANLLGPPGREDAREELGRNELPPRRPPPQPPEPGKEPEPGACEPVE